MKVAVNFRIRCWRHWYCNKTNRRTRVESLKSRAVMAEQSEVTAEEEQKSRPVKLEYEQINGIRHVFDTLDEGNVGQVPKSKLQVLCASICRDLGVNYSADDLTNFKENSSSSLSCQDFVEYLQEELLPKGNVPNTSVNNKDHILPGLDINQKIKELCWKIVEQKFLSKHEHLLSENEAFQQWLVFNILDIDQRSKVHKEELGIILQMFSHGVGKAWNVKPLEEFCEEEELTFWQYLECLESVYMAGNDQSVNQEALQEICDHVLHQVIKQGYLTKKGHKIKSSKHRWFVLKPGQLLYYTSRAQQEKKGEIIVTKGAKVEGASAGKCKFIVMCADTKRVYDIEAIDQRTKQEWIAAIQSTIDTSDGPTPQHRERMQRRLQRQVRKQAKLEEERIKREQEEFMRIQQEQLDQLKQKYEETEAKAADEAAALQEEIRKREEEEKSLKREQDEILKRKQEELELLRLKHAAAEAQAQEEAEALQEEIKKREELERLQKDLEQLLENERLARVEEEKARALQEQLLVQEKKRLEELERLKAEKEQLLDMEKKSREDLEEKHREKERLLEEERTRLEELDMERQKAEEAMREAQEKLSAAEEASRLAAEEAKKKAREIKTSVGLARPIGPKVPRFVTHRGQGAFNELDFVKKEKLKEIMKEREERKLQNHQEIDSDKASEAPSSGGCDSLKATDETAVNDATDAKVSSEVPSSGGCDSLKATKETAVNDATVAKVSSEVPSSGGCDSLEATEETAVNDATDAKVSSEVPSSGGCDSLKATAETAVNGATVTKVSEESDVDKNQDEMNVKETNDCCSDE